MTRAKYHSFTKEDIKTIAKIWDTQDVSQIAMSLGASKQSVQRVVYALRKAGVPLITKKRRGYFDLLIKEVASELRGRR